MSVYEHFRDEERYFIDQVSDWKNFVSDEYRPKLTDFLNPREQHILETVIGKNEDVLIAFSGGFPFAERKRALLYPSYYEVNESDFELIVYELVYPTKFLSIEHSQILGAMMNIGLKREKFGDIVELESRFQFAVSKEVADYIQLNFTSVGKAKTRMEEVPEKELIESVTEYEEITLTVSSLRIDTVLSEVFKISRTKVKPLITNEKAKVNWKMVADPSYLIQEGDVLSLRGYGRANLIAIAGQTKKDKIRIIIGKPIS